MTLVALGFVLFVAVYLGTVYVAARALYGNPYPKAQPGYTYGVLTLSFLDYEEGEE